MKLRSIPPNGSVFTVPMPTGGICMGVLVRADGQGRAYGLFFGPRLKTPRDDLIAQLRPENAILRCRFGDHGLFTKRWNVIGAIPGWTAEEWPLPMFARTHDDPTKCYITKYDDNLNVVSEAVMPASEMSGLPEDAQFGSGVVEIKLDKLLAM